MNKKHTPLSPEQMALYKSIMDKYERYRNLSEQEKENLIIEITSATYIDLLCDWAFKHVFGHNKKNLIMLLNDLLSENILDIEYNPNESNVSRPNDKHIIMDVVCHTSDRSFIVEMQRAKNEDFKNRMLYYGASLYSRQLKPRDSYNKLVPVYVICFMNFRLSHQTNQLVYKYQMREQDSGELYGRQLSVFFCELPRFSAQASETKTPVEEWFDILRNMRNFAKKPSTVSKRFDPIFEACQLDGLKNREPEQYFQAMISEEEKRGIAAAYYEDGFEDGAMKTKVSIAKRLLASGSAMDFVVSVTGLTEEQILSQD